MKSSLRILINKGLDSPARDTVDEIIRQAKIRKAHWIRCTPPWPERLEIVQGLRALQREGVLKAVYIDKEVIRVRWGSERGEREPFMAATPITWAQAAILVKERRPVQRKDAAGIAKEAKA